MKPTRRTLSTFQLHLLLTSAAVTLGFCLAVAAAIFLPLASQLSRPDLDSSTLGGIGRHALDMHASFWPVVLVCLVGSVAGAMLLYRRMTSPLLRFVRVFETVTRGEEPTPIIIRHSDYLGPQADALNRMVDALAERDAARARAIEELHRIAEDLPLTADLGIEAMELLRELRALSKELR